MTPEEAAEQRALVALAKLKQQIMAREQAITPLRMFVVTDGNGNVVAHRRRHAAPVGDWEEVEDRQEQDEIQANPRKVRRVTDPATGKRQNAELLPGVRRGRGRILPEDGGNPNAPAE